MNLKPSHYITCVVDIDDSGRGKKGIEMQEMDGEPSTSGASPVQVRPMKPPRVENGATPSTPTIEEDEDDEDLYMAPVRNKLCLALVCRKLYLVPFHKMLITKIGLIV